VVDVCVVYAVIASITGLDYVFRGRKSFRGVGERKADVERIVDVPGGGRIA
jgi:choline transport protein